MTIRAIRLTAKGKAVIEAIRLAERQLETAAISLILAETDDQALAARFALAEASAAWTAAMDVFK